MVRGVRKQRSAKTVRAAVCRAPDRQLRQLRQELRQHRRAAGGDPTRPRRRRKVQPRGAHSPWGARVPDSTAQSIEHILMAAGYPVHLCGVPCHDRIAERT
ncbi:hypothetical protein GCM10023082_56230 [Streptomyces tremellae]|uniref:Uncharacterized protein n=1 Tax=Streptomyces tremellae TaxID=1124239 RepID=A0ABP7G2X5_9ACTN